MTTLPKYLSDNDWTVNIRKSGLIEWYKNGVGHPAPIPENKRLFKKGLAIHGCNSECREFNKFINSQKKRSINEK